MLNRTTRSMALGVLSAALVLLVGCAAETPKPEAPTPAPQPTEAPAPAPTEAPAPAPAPEMKPAPKPAPAPVAKKVTLTTDNHFDFDKSVIRPDGKQKLDDLLDKIQDLQLEVVIAIGHADRIGSMAYNQKLSERRADAVKAYLMSNGVDENRIYTEGKGETQPVKSCPRHMGSAAALIACLAPNRRVEIEVIGTSNM